jgi:hypothetical protein
MEELTLERADATVSAMHEALSDAPDLSERLGLWDEDLRSRFNAFAVGFCFFKYIDFELDSHSLGDGALGRMSNRGLGLLSPAAIAPVSAGTPKNLPHRGSDVARLPYALLSCSRRLRGTR